MTSSLTYTALVKASEERGNKEMRDEGRTQGVRCSRKTKFTIAHSSGDYAGDPEISKLGSYITILAICIYTNSSLYMDHVWSNGMTNIMCHIAEE